MADNLERCCLCSTDVSVGTNKTKRRKLRGEASKVALEVIDSVSIRHFGRTFSCFVRQNQDTYLCHKCKAKAEAYGALLNKIRLSEEELVNVIGSVVRSGRKRAFDDSSQHVAHGPEKVVQQEVEEDKETSSVEDLNSTESGDNSAVSVNIKWPSGQHRNFPIITPERRRIVKAIARKNMRSFSSATLHSQSSTSKSVINRVSKLIRDEMKAISADSNKSIVQDKIEGIKHFKWSVLLQELSQRMPFSVQLILSLVSGRNDNHRVILVCFVISILLKNRCPKMALAQRAISILLYGNGCSKQVYNCLQPLMVCLSHSGTLKLVDKLAEDHDIKAQFWSNDLKKRLESHNGSEKMDSIPFQPTIFEYEEATVQSNDYVYEEWEFDDNEPNDIDTEQETGAQGASTDEVLDVEKTLGFLDKEHHKEDEGSNEETMDQETGTQGASTDTVWESNTDIEETLEFLDTKKNDACQKENEALNDSEWNGFKLVGDNLDKNFRRTFQRADYTTISHHYFHMFAVKDRVNLSELSDSQREGVIDVPLLLPTEDDHMKMRREFSILLSRVLVKHLSQFKKEAKTVIWHIPHPYSTAMAMKSTIVPLGVEFRNENKTDEMCAIMDSLHKYIPSVPVKESVDQASGAAYEMDECMVYPILFGGDQLTAARIRGAILIRDDHDTNDEKLNGFLPVVEDWHCRMTLLKVIWTRLFSSKSACDKGTLFQIKNLIHRTSVPNDPKENVQATEDFLEVVLVAYIVTAAEREFKAGMTLDDVCHSIIRKYINIGDNDTMTCNNDSALLYGCELLTLGLVWWNYYDAIKEGDGLRVMRIWKYLMVIFKLTGHRNYAKEAALLLVQYNYMSSERVAAQLMLSRFVNTKGRVGCNIPCDLHLEHLNRRLKGIISKMESNVKPPTTLRAAKVIGIVEDICKSFNAEMNRREESDKHNKPSYQKDLKRIRDTLQQNNVLECVPNRKMGCKLVTLKELLLASVDADIVHEWIIENIVPHFIF